MLSNLHQREVGAPGRAGVKGGVEGAGVGADWDHIRCVSEEVLGSSSSTEPLPHP